jgi:hypothetical protein
MPSDGIAICYKIDQVQETYQMITYGDIYPTIFTINKKSLNIKIISTQTTFQ